jgi:AcrR family transcriptional regulator
MKRAARAPVASAKRQLILEAGLECFLAQGVGGTTVDHIRARSGASVGSFYHHFASKVEVAAALYLETLQSYQQDFLRELEAHPGARSGLEATVRQHLRWVGRYPNLASYLTHCRDPEVVAASEARVQEVNQNFFGSVQTWLRRHVNAGEIRSLPSDLYYALWMGPAEVFTRLWLASGRSRARLAEAQIILPPTTWETLRVDPRG